MSYSNARPKWWQLYLTFPLLIGLFLLEHRLRLSTGEHQAMQIGILVFVYGLIHLWFKANSSALSRMDRMQPRETIIISRIPSRQMPGTNVPPFFQVPSSEIKGLLSDTFEMDIVDAKFVPTDEALQKTNKE